LSPRAIFGPWAPILEALQLVISNGSFLIGYSAELVFERRQLQPSLAGASPIPTQHFIMPKASLL